jgi:hypothetical protein
MSIDHEAAGKAVARWLDPKGKDPTRHHAKCDCSVCVVSRAYLDAMARLKAIEDAPVVGYLATKGDKWDYTPADHNTPVTSLWQHSTPRLGYTVTPLIAKPQEPT